MVQAVEQEAFNFVMDIFSYKLAMTLELELL